VSCAVRIQKKNSGKNSGDGEVRGILISHKSESSSEDLFERREKKRIGEGSSSRLRWKEERKGKERVVQPDYLLVRVE